MAMALAQLGSPWCPRSVVYEGLRRSQPMKQQRQPSQQRANAAARVLLTVRAATLPLLSFEGERAGTVELDLKVASILTAKGLVHRGVIAELQNRRRGTASTKTRAEVRGGGRKPYKQKGTGRARRGSQRTPLRPGGGIVFGPKPKDWRIKINKKEKRLAISTAIQSAAVDSIAVEDFEHKFEVPKTKEFLAAMERWGMSASNHNLIFATNVTDYLNLSSRNIKTVKMLTPRSLNLYDILRADKLIFTKSGIDYLNGRYGAKATIAEDDDEDDEDGEEEEEDEDQVNEEDEDEDQVNEEDEDEMNDEVREEGKD